MSQHIVERRYIGQRMNSTLGHGVSIRKGSGGKWVGAHVCVVKSPVVSNVPSFFSDTDVALW